MDQRTCLYITHRLGSTYLFDKCLVLNDGIIQEIGAHHELMAIKDGLYKNLYEKQKSWYEEDFEAIEKV
jgi:ATP-binding cassette subfamily B protein